MCKICSVPGCGRKLVKYGYCNMHWLRMRRNGNLEPRKPMDAKSYKFIYAPGHPLSQRSTGRVLVHRKVLFDKIGPGAHPCHYCNKLLTWGKVWPEADNALIVDHKNRNRHDNAEDNLVPCCHLCNAKRPRSAFGAFRLMKEAVKNGHSKQIA